MDKGQKQLLDTYLRKRDITQSQGDSWRYKYRIYETIYMLKNEMYDKVDPNKLDGSDITEILIKEPTLISLLKHYLKKLNVTKVKELLTVRPEFIQYMQQNARSPLLKLNEHSIYKLLLAQPSLIKSLVPEQIMHLMTPHAIEILTAHPETIDDLMMHVRRFDSEDLAIVLIKQPELAERLKPFMNKIDKVTAKMLAMNVPELKPYMDNIKRDNVTLE
jgi:hypothetical protein